MFSYRKILKQSLKITWHNKYLWFFGLFATFLGAGGEYQIINKIVENNGSTALNGLGRFVAIFNPKLWSNIGPYFAEDPRGASISIILLLLALAIFIFLVILTVSSQVALVDQAKKLYNNEKKDLGISKGMVIGQSHFWPVLGINILVKFIIACIFFLITLPIILTASTSWLTIIIYVVLFLIFIPVVIGLSLIAKYAIAYIVIKKNKFVEAIDNAFKLFSKNWVISLEMAFILILINILVGFTILIAMFAIAAPFVILSLIFANYTIFWLVTFLGFAILILAVIWLGSMLTAFLINSWTKLFLELLDRKGVSKIKRLKDKEKNTQKKIKKKRTKKNK
ncbi:hypothetical protein K9M50_01310 [Patescibacteria group bacterium]|nr:hypothetical protein [Patescibacteria group bacterium]